MTKTKDQRPTVTLKDLVRAWYDQTPDGWALRLMFRKDGQTGTMRFGLFETRDEAREFFVQLKQGVV